MQIEKATQKFRYMKEQRMSNSMKDKDVLILIFDQNFI